MSNKATVVFTVDKASGNLRDTFVGTNPQLVMSNFANFISAIKGGSDAASISVVVAEGTSAAASGSFEGATVEVADTATIGGFEFTCVDAKESTTVQCVADVASSLNNTYFTFFSANNATKYYAWYNVDAAGTDPAVASATGIEIAIAAGDTANTVAAATQAAIDAIASADVLAEVATDTVTLTNLSVGVTTNAANGAAAANPGFTITVINAGAAVGADEFQIGADDAESMGNFAVALAAGDPGTFLDIELDGTTVNLTATEGAIGNGITLAATGGISASDTRMSGGASATDVSSASYAFAR